LGQYSTKRKSNDRKFEYHFSHNKQKEDEEEEEVGEPEEGEEEEEEQEPEPVQEDGDEEVVKKVYVSYKEKDYARRKPSPKYEIFKSIETLCLSAGNSKKNLLTYVLCGGVLYGNGEETFANYFKVRFEMRGFRITIFLYSKPGSKIPLL